MKTPSRFRLGGFFAVAMLGMWSSAVAATKLSVGSLSVDGQEVRQLSCEMAEGGLLATVTIVATLAKSKQALDRWFYRTFLEHPTENRFTASQFVAEVESQGIQVGRNSIEWFLGDLVVGVGIRL